MLHLNPIEWFASLPSEWAVFFISMIPLTELRAAVPLGIEYYKLPIEQVWALSVLGNIVPVLFILLFIPIFHKWAVDKKFLGKALAKFLDRAEKKFSGKHAKYGALGLILFVGIPLPMTGAWTGALAAFVFNIPYKKAVKLIFLGLCVAATFVTLITLFAGGVIRGA